MEVLESKIIRAESAAIPEIKNNLPKLLRLWLVDEMDNRFACLTIHSRFSLFYLIQLNLVLPLIYRAQEENL